MEPDVSFNLLTDPWLPILRRSGPAQIAPHQLTEAIDTDPVLALDWPRPDLQLAGFEFLAGLLATLRPPRSHDAWTAEWRQPPTPEALRAAFAPFAHAFSLDGSGPRFMQDFEDLVSEEEPIERLFIEAPGGSTVRNNTDLLNRRGRIAALERPAAAMALYTFQSWAPAGGAGNRTGLRGGGPMVTPVLPGGARSLFHTIWANVPVGRPPRTEELPLVFPWLAPTVGSASGRTVTPEIAHPSQAWWGMPRRIRLVFRPVDPPEPCGLTGRPDTVAVVGWRQRPHGANYAIWGEVHPLTPRYRVKPDAEILPLHPQPGGIGYRHWLSLVVQENQGFRFPAPAVTTWRELRAEEDGVGSKDDRLLAAGFDMDNMKARGFVESELPIPVIPDAAVRKRVDALAPALVKAAEAVAAALRRAGREALFAPGASVKLDWELLSTLRERLWARTEAAFHQALNREASRQPRPDEPTLGSVPAEWHALLRRHAFDLFDEAASLDFPLGAVPKSDTVVTRILDARRRLGLTLSGFGKDGAALFIMLGLPPAETRQTRKARA